MGLDITAYSKIALDPDAKVDSDGYPVDWDGGYFVANLITLSDTDKHWPGRTGGIAAGVYRYESSFDFRAGSYGGYNSWRNDLAALAGYGCAADVWASPQPGPFVELINFSDCEGIIAGDAAKRLARDFADFQSKVGTTGGFAESYADWRKAFELAADDGAVEFH